MISKRQKEILRLLKGNQSYLTADWLARKVGVSSRTIRSEIKVLKSECNQFGVVIESARGMGYALKIVSHDNHQTTSEHVFNQGTMDHSVDFAESSNRVCYMLKRFLQDKGYIKLDMFAEEMYVSKSTIQQDMKKLREILKKYSLKLIARSHYGSRVTGDEYMKRLCFSNYIIRNSNLSIYSEPYSFSDQNLYDQIKAIIIRTIDEYKIDICDIALENLTIHIAIACQRIEKGFIIEKLKQEVTREHWFERVVAMKIVRRVERLTSLHFNEGEIDYIIVHLAGTKLLHKSELMEYSAFDGAGNIIDCMLKRLKSEMNWDFREDNELIQALTLHIRPAMNRLRYHIIVRNPLLNEIKNKYSRAFEGAVIASKCIQKYLGFGVDEDEIGYIALHLEIALERLEAKERATKKVKRVLIVCASGVGSAKLLYYRLQRHLGKKIEIVGTTHYYKLESSDLSGVDLIISTIPIKENLGIPVQVVNTFLSDKDINNINTCLNPAHEQINVYMDPSRIFIHKELKNKEDVIFFLSHVLYNQGLVSNQYVNLVLERENIASTCYGNLVAIPHPLSPVTEATFWTICTLKQPILWDDRQMVQFVCLLNIEKKAKGKLSEMYRKLISIIENRAIVQKLIQSSSVQQIIECMIHG